MSLTADFHTRRDFLRTAGLGAAALAFRMRPGFAGTQVLDRPNIIIALCDDLGYGDLGCFGHPHIKTPNLDLLAVEGMRLTDCYAAAPVCSPARAGILTGRTPYRCGIYDWIPNNAPMHLRREEITVAALLRNAGYATCHVGKWHCNGKFNSPDQPQPNDHGFDYWFSTQNNAHPTHLHPDNFIRNGVPVGPLNGYSSELIVDEAIHWLRDHWDKVRPFCMFVWFHAPHEPIATGEEFMNMYEGRREAIYYGNVSQMDHAFGRLMKTVDDMNLRDSVFVMFTSDNGPETLNRYPGSHRSFGSPGPLRGMKLHMYEGGIRVPGIVRWPNRVRPGSMCAEPVNGTDILPTLCAMAGVAVPTDRAIDGTSILPIFEGHGIERQIPLYWRYDGAQSRPYTVAMRQRDWKILADTSMTRFELYNLRTDLGETNDRAESEPGRLEDMKKTLRKLHQEIAADGITWQ